MRLLKLVKGKAGARPTDPRRFSEDEGQLFGGGDETNEYVASADTQTDAIPIQ